MTLPQDSIPQRPGPEPLRAFVVDDEPLAVDRIRQALEGVPGVEVTGWAHDAAAATEALRATAPDLLLLDIEMPGASGLDLARTLGEDGPEVVFVTAFQDHAASAFDLAAVDYVVKPFEPDRLRAAVWRARRRRAAPVPPAPRAFLPCIWAPTRSGLVRVPVCDIEWVEAAGDYVLVHTQTQSHLLRGPLSALAERLDPARIVRTHRSALVQLDAVREVRRTRWGRWNLVLQSGSIVPVGELYQAQLEAALNHRETTAKAEPDVRPPQVEAFRPAPDGSGPAPGG